MTSRTEPIQRPVVCHVLHNLRVGGAELLASGLGRKLRPEFQSLFVCLDDTGELAEELQAEGFTVCVIGRSPGIDIGCARRLSRCLSQEQVDLVHAHQYAPFFYTVMSRLYGPRPPVMFTEHGRHYPDVRRRRRVLFNRLFLRRKDRVVAVGNAVREALVLNEGIPRTRVQVVRNGIDLDRFSSSPVARMSLRQELGVGPSTTVIVQVARLHQLKDHLTALRAMSRVASGCRDVRLLIVGDGPERSVIEAEIARRELQEVVQLLGQRDDVGQLLSAADIAMLTSLSEGTPVTLIEAMAAGLPVVATRVGGVEEVVEDGAAGLLVSAGDDAGLAHAIDTLAANPTLRTRMGHCGLERARSMFSEQQMLSAYRELYERMTQPA